MSGGFTGRCFTCGGRGHMAYECPNNWVGRTNQVDRQAAGNGELRAADDTGRLAGDFTGRAGIENPGAQPARPQGQAGRGSLPGARNAQGSRAGAGLLGNHRVSRARGSRGREHQNRQRREGGRQMRLDDDDDDDDDEDEEEEDFTDGRGAGYTRGQENMGAASGHGRMDQEQGEAGNHAARASSVDSEEPPQGPSMHGTGAHYQVGPGQVMASRLSNHEVHSLVARMTRLDPQGIFDIVLVRRQTVDDTASDDTLSD